MEATRRSKGTAGAYWTSTVVQMWVAKAAPPASRRGWSPRYVPVAVIAVCLGSVSNLFSQTTTQRAQYVGRALVANGQPPPPGTPVRMDCQEGDWLETSTDHEGRFAFFISKSSNGPLQGEDGTALKRQPLLAGLAAFGCKISVPGTKYRSYRTEFPTVPRRGFDPNNFVTDQGLIILYDTVGSTGSLISATSFAAPAEAKAAFKRGQKLLTLDPPKAVAAQAEMREAVRLYPQFAAAWSGLGHALTKSGDSDGAREALNRAIEADPLFIEPYPELLALLTAQQDWPKIADAAANWTALSPESVEAAYFLALGLFGTGDFEGSERAALRVAASEQEPQFPQAHYLLGAVYALRGEFEVAARNFRRFTEIQPEGELADAARALLREWRRDGSTPNGSAVPLPHGPSQPG